MSQQAEQGATTAAKRPGKRDGQASEFTINLRALETSGHRYRKEIAT